MTAATTHRFPKWLAAETYTIIHDRRTPGKFTVTLVRGARRQIGHGPTISRAARRAAKNRGK